MQLQQHQWNGETVIVVIFTVWGVLNILYVASNQNCLGIRCSRAMSGPIVQLCFVVNLRCQFLPFVTNDSH